MKTWQKYLAEAFGTFVLVGIGAGVMMSGGGAIATAFAFGFAWMAALYTIGRVSGGHLNPVLSLAAFLDRAISLQDLIGYWVAQFVGAIGALGIFAWLFSKAATMGAVTDYQITDFKAFSVEAILALILTMAFLAMMRSGAHTKYLGMGFTLLALTLFGFGVTGASMNPARTIAPALFASHWHGIWVYIVGPIVGAIVGWVLYRVIVRGDTNFMDDLGEIKDSIG
jgi:MIP family channel proteins